MRKEKIDNPRYPHHITIVRKVYRDWLSESSSSSDDDLIVYDGVGRSYTDTTTTGNAHVDSNKRKASIPMRFDEWGELIPLSGDILYVTKNNISEEWEVKDFEPDNDRSVVYGELNRNLNM
jgi:hypothetical protein